MSVAETTIQKSPSPADIIKMIYFEVKERLTCLLEFRRLYTEYLRFTNRYSNQAAQLVRAKMEPLAAMTVDSLRCVKLGSMLTKAAPARGGRTMKINLIRAIFRDNVIREYNLDERAPLRILDTGIVKYRTRLWRQKIQLFNPFFWLFQMTAFLAALPLHILRRAGYDTGRAEKTSVIRVYVASFQFVCLYVVFNWLGLIDWFQFYLLAR
jgi:hypothetical protein